MTSTLAALAPPARIDLDLDRLGPGFGANVRGVDLATADDETVAAVRRALIAHKVLFFPGQRLDPDSQVALGTGGLGETTASHPVVPGIDKGHAEIYALDRGRGRVRGRVAHRRHLRTQAADGLRCCAPFNCRPLGGDTNWADLQLAYDSLSAPVRDLADRLTAVHDGSRAFGYYLAQRGVGEGSEWEGEPATRFLDPVEHPVVRVHPETGRKGLFVNPGFTSHIVGVSDAESRGILDLLYAHISRSPSTSCGIAGTPVTWRCGTTGPPPTTPTVTTATSAGSCTASPCGATSRSAWRPCGSGSRRKRTVRRRDHAASSISTSVRCSRFSVRIRVGPMLPTGSPVRRDTSS